MNKLTKTLIGIGSLLLVACGENDHFTKHGTIGNYHGVAFVNGMGRHVTIKAGQDCDGGYLHAVDKRDMILKNGMEDLVK